MSQMALSERTKLFDRHENKGLPRSVLVGYESGKFKPGARELRLLCAALGLDVATLLYGEGADKAEDIERLNALLYAGTFDSLSSALRVAFGLLRLKAHEREAFSTLIFGLVSRTFKRKEDADELWFLADLLQIDLNDRLSRLSNSEVPPGRAIATGKGLAELVQAMERVVNQIPPGKDASLPIVEVAKKKTRRKSV